MAESPSRPLGSHCLLGVVLAGQWLLWLSHLCQCFCYPRGLYRWPRDAPEQGRVAGDEASPTLDSSWLK